MGLNSSIRHKPLALKKWRFELVTCSRRTLINILCDFGRAKTGDVKRRFREQPIFLDPDFERCSSIIHDWI